MENTALFPLNFLKCTCIEQYIWSSAESILNRYNMKLISTVMVNCHWRFTVTHSDTQAFVLPHVSVCAWCTSSATTCTMSDDHFTMATPEQWGGESQKRCVKRLEKRLIQQPDTILILPPLCCRNANPLLSRHGPKERVRGAVFRLKCKNALMYWRCFRCRDWRRCKTSPGAPLISAITQV